MNAHHTKVDSAPALIEVATSTLARVSRVALHAAPYMRLRLRDEIALLEMMVDKIEGEVKRAAQATLDSVPQRRALPAARRALVKGGTP